MTINLPIQGMNESVEDYLNRLVTDLERTIAEDAGGTSLPIYDTSGNVLLDNDGHYIRRNDGSLMVQPDIVQVDTQDIVDAAIATAKLADQSVETTKIANLAVGQAQIADAAIVAAKIGDLQVTTAKIDDLAVNDAKIANLNVGKLEAGNIGANNIYLGSGTNFELDGVNRRMRITDDNGTLRLEMGELGAGSTNYGLDIYDASGDLIVGANGLGVSVVGGTQITNGAISAAAGHISDLSADDITTGTMTAGAINAAFTNVYNLNASNIRTGTLSANRIDTSAIFIGNLNGAGSLAQQNSVDQYDITSIDGGVIVTNTVTADALFVDNLGAISANLGFITAGSINSITIDSSTITGGTIRTSSGNTRVEMDGSSNKFVIYEGGSIDFELDWTSSLSPYLYAKSSSSATTGLFVNNGSGNALASSGNFTCFDNADINGNLDVDGIFEFSGDAAMQSAGGDLVLNPGQSFGETRADGDLVATGSKPFDIPYPGKLGWRIRYYAMEGPEVCNFHRFHVQATASGETLEVELAEHWPLVNDNEQVCAFPIGHFGRAYGEVSNGKLYVTCEQPGDYGVWVTTRRCDENVRNRKVEYKV